MNFRDTTLVFILAALALGACAHKPLAVTGKAGVKQAYYVNAGAFKTMQFSPPPVPGSMQQQADIATVLSWQNKRTEADCARSSRTAVETYDAFWGARSPFPEPLPSEVKEFFERLASDLEEAVNNIKNRYQRPRPYLTYPEAQPCLNKIHGFSYPSGHAVFSGVFARVLTDIIPERESEFSAKADEIARDRVIGGVHYPADIAAGKVFADQYHAKLLKSEAYRKDIGKIKILLAK